MTSRFASNMMALLAGAFLTAASLGFAPAVIGWLALAVGCAVAATILVAFALRGRGIAQRALDVALLALAAWTVVAARSFGGVTLHWLCFASGVALVAIACIALVVHEALLELALKRTVTLGDDGHVVRVQERPPVGVIQ